MNYNKRYELKYAYTLEEMLANGLDSQSGDISRQIFSVYGVALPDTTTLPSTYFDNKSLFTSLMGLVWQRHKGDTTVISEENWNGDINNYNFYGDLCKKTVRWAERFINIAMFTHLKYETLLGLYAAQKDNLLNKLQKVYSGTIANTGSQSVEGSNTGTQDTETHNFGSQSIEGTNTGTSAIDETKFRKENDTPQGSGDFSGDTHASMVINEKNENVRVDDLQNSSTRTDDLEEDVTRTDNLKNSSVRVDDLLASTDYEEQWDVAPIIDRLKDIDDKFQKVMFDWVKEFDGLFIEEANIHEY